MSDQPVAEATTHTKHIRRASISSAGFEPAIQAVERPADICVRPKDDRDWPFFITLFINL